MRAPVPARGYVEDLAFEGPSISLSGWMVVPDEPLDGHLVRIGAATPVPAEAVLRTDVALGLPGLQVTGATGFRATLPAPRPAAWSELEVLGTRSDRPIGRLALDVHPDYERFAPPAPTELTERVAHLSDRRPFLLDGLRSMHDLLSALRPHLDLDDPLDVLDWGCGCGRVTVPVARRMPHWTVTGTDVDPRAVAWCRDHVAGMRFDQTPPLPPTRLPAASFDAIFAYSVFTHLAREAQLAWVEELARLLRPGGRLVATVQGEHAARFTADEVSAELERDGLSDERIDRTLERVLPHGLYREVYRAEAWTRAAWSAHVTLLDYVHAGAGGFHDVVVATRT